MSSAHAKTYAQYVEEEKLKTLYKGFHARGQGNLLEVKGKINQFYKLPEEKRGEVKGFSRAARVRMLKCIARIDWQRVPHIYFVTLTYPPEKESNFYWHRSYHRKRFQELVEEHVGHQVGTVWRVEWKARRSGKFKGLIRPHIHLCIFGVRYMDYTDFKRIWKRVLQVKGHAITWADRVKGGEDSAKYVCKYTSKDISLDVLDNDAYRECRGRAWGATRPELIPRCAVERIPELNQQAIDKAMSIAGRVLGRHYLGSYCVLGTAAPALLREIAISGNLSIVDEEGT